MSPDQRSNVGNYLPPYVANALCCLNLSRINDAALKFVIIAICRGNNRLNQQKSKANLNISPTPIKFCRNLIPPLNEKGSTVFPCVPSECSRRTHQEFVQLKIS